jgi:hypothetical protein
MPLLPSPSSLPVSGSLLNYEVKNTSRYELSLNKQLMGDTSPITDSIRFGVKISTLNDDILK